MRITSGLSRVFFSSLLSMMFLFSVSCGSGTSTDSVSGASAAAPTERQPVAVETLEVTPGSLIPVVESSGVIQGIHEAIIMPEASGKIQSVHAAFGQTVKKGDILFQIEGELLRLNKDLALQQYSTAKADFDAVETSYKNGGISRSDYNGAKSRLLQTKNAYESANTALENTRIKASIDGTVASISSDVSAGNYITAGTPAGRIIDTSKLSMEIYLGERQVRLVKPGMKAVVETTEPTYRFDATVSAVGTGADPATASFPVKLVWENREQEIKYSGISARVSIPVDDNVQSLVVPSSSIVTRDGSQSVFIAKGNTCVLHRVQTGDTLGGRTTILEGLSEGDSLIISALSSLSDGFPITAAKVGTTGSWK